MANELPDAPNNDRAWIRSDKEPNRWFQRFERFRLLGPDRSVLGVFNEWRLAKSRKVSRSAPKSWRDMAVYWQWHDRAEAWDQYISELASAAAETERLRILSSGYALKHKRVDELNQLAVLLLQEIREEDKRWVPDVKSIGSGKFAERVDIVRFNASLIEQARQTLEDIAAEMGDRMTKHALSGKLDVINMSIEDWKAAQSARRAQAEQTQALFEGEDE